MKNKLKKETPDFAELSRKEWLVTNGIGGFASSSVSGANTRKYHGLLVASFNPPTERKVLVSKVEEKVIAAKEEFYICTNAYPENVHPKGYLHLDSFTRTPLPKSTFIKGKYKLSKTTFMRHGSNTTVVEYTNHGNEALLLELTPLFVYRDYHHLFQEDDLWDYETIELEERLLKISPDKNASPLYVSFTAGIFYEHPDWYRNFEYEREKERGMDYHEDARSIGKISCMLGPGENAFLTFSTILKGIKGDPEKWKRDELKRLKGLSKKSKTKFISDLMISGDQFLVDRKSSSSKTLLAGYPWFTDWGRDTMIAMRGLVIATGKKEEAKSMLKTFLKYLDQGMIPNRFPDTGGKPEYNTMDATLWLFVALYDYYEQFKDKAFIKTVFDDLTRILESHAKGTRYNIHLTKEGLVYGGQEGTQLTWMDAKVGNYVVTPRIGCPVEINALWYNALSVYISFGKLLGVDVDTYIQKEKDFKRVFRKWFLNEKDYLNDVVNPGQPADESIRPNMLYAISLPFSPLTLAEGKQMLKVITEHLYTDYGLRSLSKKDPNFKPIFSGDQWSRDNAYHQGTIWSFLWGEYALAYLKINKNSAAAKKWVNDHVAQLEHHFYKEEGLYCLSENFDGGVPSEGKGCIHQAWSVGMTLLALLKANQ